MEVEKYTRNLSIKFLPTLFPFVSEGNEIKMIIGRINEMMADLNALLELGTVIGSKVAKGTIEFHQKMESLEKRVELDLEDITKGYLGFVEYEFAKGIIKDLVEEKYEKNMQELHSSIEVK